MGAIACKAESVALRVLIVDDNVSFLHVARAVLEREGVAVAGVASNVSDALREAEQLPLDVVLVDITLAGESGFELARCLAEQNRNRDGDMAVILISTRAEADFADLIAESPARAFLPKSELSADAIHRILDDQSRLGAPRA
ncbi:MAG TPA: response regulator [Solirubrobacteraceae bacterium]|jgi:two-component system nitrate/nitrite response regulator NarL|nr:response regulator [Solirubrobacteraceae bacterium]